MNTTRITQVKVLVADSFGLAGKLLKEQAVPLAVLFGLTLAISLTLEDVMQNLTRAQEDQRWMLQLGLGLIDLFEGIALILLLGWGIPKVRQLTEAHFLPQPFQSSYLNSFLAEYMRTLAQVLLYALLLVVPGFVRYARLIFVPYVTLFAKPYRDDQVDALELSKELTRGRLPVIFAVVIATMAVQIGLEVLPQGEAFHSIALRIACGALSFVVSTWSFAFLYLLFELAMEEYQWRTPDGPDL